MSPLFPHPPAALGELIASGSELMGLCGGEAASPVSVPGGAQPPPGAATAVLQRARAALHSSRSLTVGQKRSQPFAAGPTSAWGAGLGREVVRTQAQWVRKGGSDPEYFTLACAWLQTGGGDLQGPVGLKVGLHWCVLLDHNIRVRYYQFCCIRT